MRRIGRLAHRILVILACLAAYAGMIGIPIACAARRVLAGPACRDGRGIVGERT